MKNNSNLHQRREFLKLTGLSALPFLSTSGRFFSSPNDTDSTQQPINFISDGLFHSPGDYIQLLQSIHDMDGIQRDFYGNGGVVQSLEAQFADITGKEKAIYLPSGTMANQLAIRLLSGQDTKVIVPENAHIYRDEADAAQSVHQKRLIPVGHGKSFFELQDLKESINYLAREEVFKSGLSTIVIENPIRRADGTHIPMDTIQSISSYARSEGFKLHLDGARLHIASAYSGISIKEYAALFDTVYISLYKYLNAAGGAILCGDAELIEQIPHFIKILGGTVYQNWVNAAAALHYLKDIDAQWSNVVNTSRELILKLNQISGIHISPITSGTNIYNLQLDPEIHGESLSKYLYEDHAIYSRRPDEKGQIKWMVNASILSRPVDDIVFAFQESINKAQR